MPRRPPSEIPVTDFSNIGDNSKRMRLDDELSCEGSSDDTTHGTTVQYDACNLTIDVDQDEYQTSTYLHGLISNPEARADGGNEMEFLAREFALKNKPEKDGEGLQDYVENTARRNRIKRALIWQIKNRLELLHKRTGIQGCLVYILKNEVHLEAPDAMRPALASNDDAIKQTFKRACCPAVPETIFRERIKVSLPPRDASLTVCELRQIITTAVNTDVNKKYISPNWGKPEYRPEWWPESIPYTSPHENGTVKHHKPQLLQLYYAYWDYTKERNNSSLDNLIRLQARPSDETVVEVPSDMEVQLESTYFINIKAALKNVQCLTKKAQRLLLQLLDDMSDNSSDDEAIALCKRLHEFLPRFPTFTSDDFDVAKTHVEIRFRNFASKCGLLEQDYEPILCRGDGSCLFNAISIALLGVDGTSDLLRAISYVHAMAYVDRIDAWIKAKKLITDSEEDVLAFVTSYGLDISSDVSSIKDCILSEAKTTLKGGVFSGFLQAVFLAGFLKITIHQHTFIDSLMEFNHPVEPVPSVAKVERDCHIMWVPEDSSDNPLPHVVPLMKAKQSLFNDRCTVIPFYCGAEKLCQHFEGECRLSDDSTTLSLVQCSKCCRWFHRQCVGFFTAIFEDDCQDQWSCGCDLTNPWASTERQKFNDPREIQRLLNNTIILRELIVNITSNKIVSKRKQILEKNSGETWGPQTLVTDRTSIEYLCRKLQSFYSCAMNSPFLQDVIIPEVLSWALTEKLKTTRLSAEVLLQDINYLDIYF